MENINGYSLIREWYNFKFENPSKCKSVHSDFYCYIIDLWNRLGQKKEFGLPTSVTMECLGIGSYNTYKNTLNDLVNFGFIKIVSDAKNQHQSKVIAISKNDKASDKALDKANIKAIDKAGIKATDTIIEQVNKGTKKQIIIPSFEEFFEYCKSKYIEEGKNPGETQVLVLGVTFKENVSDIRNSKVFALIKELQDFGVQVTAVDPHANPEQVFKEYGVVCHSELVSDAAPSPNTHHQTPITHHPTPQKFDALVLAVAHQEFQVLSIGQLEIWSKDELLLFDIKGIKKGLGIKKYWKL
jgi:UDP-N-acetyl-D-mannosaminuronate dehydrogenase